MPQRRSATPKPPARANFRRRYDELEARRAALVARLAGLSEAARRHPGYRRALTLLNDTFRKEKLAQRLAVLQAAAWLIDRAREAQHAHLTPPGAPRAGLPPARLAPTALPPISACGGRATLVAVSGKHRQAGLAQR